MYWNGSLVALGAGLVVALSFPYAWTSGDDEFVTLIFPNVTPNDNVSASIEFICPAYARPTPNPCGNVVLVPAVITDKNYTEHKVGLGFTEFDFNVEDSITETFNNR
jgi:hypothetical protein